MRQSKWWAVWSCDCTRSRVSGPCVLQARLRAPPTYVHSEHSTAVHHTDRHYLLRLYTTFIISHTHNQANTCTTNCFTEWFRNKNRTNFLQTEPAQMEMSANNDSGSQKALLKTTQLVTTHYIKTLSNNYACTRIAV